MAKRTITLTRVNVESDRIRPIKELLGIMLYYLRNGNYSHFTGLCGLASKMLFLEYISYKEYVALCDYIKTNAKPHKIRLTMMTAISILHVPSKSYYWPKGLKWPRINWLTKQIKSIK